jgi:hypothetical protein
MQAAGENVFTGWEQVDFCNVTFLCWSINVSETAWRLQGDNWRNEVRTNVSFV